VTPHAPTPVQIHPDVVFRVLGDGAVLVNLSSSEIFELNGTGAAIWEQLSRGESADEVVARVMTLFDVDRARADREVADFLGELRSRGLITP
jgi:hypothetical protein